MKKELLQRLETEVKACKRYTENSIRKAQEGKIGAAINLLDIANTAKICADQVHEELWQDSKGDLSEEEFKLFAESETLYQDINKAYKELQKARQK